MPSIFYDEWRAAEQIWSNPARTRPISPLDIVVKRLKWTLYGAFHALPGTKWATPAL